MQRILSVATLFCLSISASASEVYFWKVDATRAEAIRNEPVPEDCRAQIKKAMCLVELPFTPDAAPNRPCVSGGEKYAPIFEALHDEFPGSLQKMFCSLKKIYIETSFFGTGYAGFLKDENDQIVGARMGVRKSVLDDALSLSHWASWKEQLSFGGERNGYEVNPALPRAVTTSSFTESDFLYFLVAHEMGHLFDFANDLNKTRKCGAVTEQDPFPECEMDPTSWAGISWITSRQTKPEHRVAERERLCFYSCDGKFVPLASVREIYSTLDRSNFISTYSTAEPWNDFADSLAYFLMNKRLHSHYYLDTRQGQVYDVMAKLRSERWKEKRDYLERFLKRTDIVYP